MSSLYHGSPISGIKELRAGKNPTHGKYVYATANKTIAIVMAGKNGSDLVYSFYEGNDGKYILVERMPDVVKTLFKDGFSLYYVDSKDFKRINTGFDEVVSDHDVKVIKEERYENGLDAIKQLVDSGSLTIYYYPDRPERIPDDDSDLIDKINHYINDLHWNLDKKSYCRWIFCHPNLEEEIREIAKTYNVDLPPYEEIKQSFIEEQNNNPDKNVFVESAIKIKEMLKVKGKK